MRMSKKEEHEGMPNQRLREYEVPKERKKHILLIIFKQQRAFFNNIWQKIRKEAKFELNTPDFYH